MLFFILILLKLGFDDARFLHVFESDLWLLLGCALPMLNLDFHHGVIIIYTSICLQLGVHYELCGNGDRDVLLIMLLVYPIHQWLMIILVSSSLALLHVAITHKRLIPFIFMLSLGLLIVHSLMYF